MAQERIEIHFKPKGDKALIRAIKELDIATKRLAGKTSRYEKELKQLAIAQRANTKAGMLGVKNMRIQAGAFATLRSKLLLYSFAVGLAGAALKKLTDKFAKQEKAEKQLSTALGKDIKALTNYASSLQLVTTFGDEEIISAQALIAAYTDDEEQIKKATQATLDLAAAKGMDLKTASDLVSKTMNSSTNALSRYGIEVEGVVGSTSRLDSLTRAITRLYEGQARAAADTFSGKLTQISNVAGDANEQIGLFLLPVIESIADAMASAAKSTLEFMTRMNELPAETLLRTFQEAGVSTENLFNLQMLANIQRAKSGMFETQDEMKDMIGRSRTLRSTLSGLFTGVALQELFVVESFNATNYEESLVRLEAQNRNLGQEIKLLINDLDGLTEADKERSEEIQREIDSILEQSVAINGLILSLKGYAEALDELKKFQLKEIEINEKTFTPLRDFLEFLDTVDSRLISTLSQFADTFGQMGTIANEAAQARIQATNDAANAEIDALKKSRKFQKWSSKRQAEEEKKIRDKADKDNAKRLKEANRFKAAEFRINQATKIRETIMATQKAFMEASPNGFLQALIVAQGIAAVGVIAAQKPPKMARGGFVGGRRHSQGGTLIEAEQGEFVMSRDAVNTIGAENLNRMNRGGGGAINVNFTGNVLSSDFIENDAIPQIKEAIRRGADIGIG